MSDFTVFDVDFPSQAKQRVIVNTDAKNEADDQYAIVHAVLTPSFELHGIIPAHFGTRKSATSMQDSHDETMLLLRLMGLEEAVRVEDGATHGVYDGILVICLVLGVCVDNDALLGLGQKGHIKNCKITHW